MALVILFVVLVVLEAVLVVLEVVLQLLLLQLLRLLQLLLLQLRVLLKLPSPLGGGCSFYSSSRTLLFRILLGGEGSLKRMQPRIGLD